MTEHHHIYELFDPSKYVQAFELDGRDVTVTIARVIGETVEGENNRKASKPVIHFTDWPKPMVLNKTNAKVLIRLYGADYRTWGGKRFTMYPTTTKLAGEEVDAIRLRKNAPPPPRTAAPPPKALTIPERVAAVKKTLRETNTVVGVESVWKKAEKLRAELGPETLDALTLEYEGRLAELQEAK